MNSGDRGWNFILISRLHRTFYPLLLVLFIVLVKFVWLLWCFCLSVFLFGVFFLSFFGVVCRSTEICGRIWVAISDEKTNKQKTKHFLIKMRKKGTMQAYFHLSIQSGLVCNGKMNLKSDFRKKILNDRYRPITFTYLRKTNKQTNKQRKTNKQTKNKQKTKQKQNKTKSCKLKISG